MNGKCQRLVLANGQNHPIALRVDADGTVFWVNRGTTKDDPGPGDTGECLGADGALMRLAPGDAQPVEIARDQRCPTDLLLVGNDVLWLTRGTGPTSHNGQVMRATKSGGSITELIGDLACPVGFARCVGRPSTGQTTRTARS